MQGYANQSSLTEYLCPNLYDQALTPTMTIFEDGAFMEVIKVKGDCKGEGPNLMGSAYLQAEKPRALSLSPSHVRIAL